MSRDDRDLCEAISFSLRQAGHDVVEAGSGASGLHRAIDRRPDLILLDLGLPGLSGLEVCEMLATRSATQHVPVVIVSARNTEEDRVAGLEAGAVDYVVKPFSMRELLFRIDNVLRNSVGPAEHRRRLEVGPLVIDRHERRLWVHGKETHIAPLQFRLLLVLCDHRGAVCTRGMLLNEVWGLASDAETRTLDAHIRRLRAQLGGARGIIRTVRGVGFRIVGGNEVV